jgi:hypothetical protein
MMRSCLICAGVLSLGVLFLTARADDWPQWRGPERSGVSKEKGLLKEWPKNGPKLLWENKEAGGGFSTPAVVGDRLYMMASTKDEESAVALSVKEQRPAVSRPALDADGGRRPHLRSRLRRRPGLPRP